MVDAKMHQNAQVCMLQFKIKIPPILVSGYGALPKPHPFSIPALHASRASLGASIAPQCSLAVDATAILRGHLLLHKLLVHN